MMTKRNISILPYIFIFILFIIFSASLLLPNMHAYGNEDSIQYENKIISKDISLSENFDDSSLIVTLDKAISAVNKIHSKDFFNNVAIKSIKDLTYINDNSPNIANFNSVNFRQILEIELMESSKENVLNTIEEIIKIEGVLSAEPNYYVEIDKEPISANEPEEGEHLYPEQWGLHGTKGIQAEQAWDLTTGSSTIRVGVLDTGLDSHPDLAGNISSDGGDFTNMINGSPGPLRPDPTGHGTHVAGIIGATGENANGVAGVAWDVELVPLQASVWSDRYNDWALDNDAMIRAVIWATANEVDIINCSAGGNDSNVALMVALSYYDGLFVCSAGNDDANNDSIGFIPGNFSYTNNRVISVGNITKSGEKSTSSNYGKEMVSIFAPGTNILSTVPTSIDSTGYAYWSGTSMAAPFVSGTAALMMSYYNSTLNNLSLAQKAVNIKTAIIDGADYESALSTLCVAQGRLKSQNGALTRIENSAFSGCSSMTNLSLPQNLTYIGYDAFNACNILESITMPAATTTICGNAFANCSDLTIYTVQAGKPGGWASNWNPSNRPVVWGCTLESGYVVSVAKAIGNPSNATSTINSPYRSSYTFGGWYTTSDFSGTQYMSILDAPNGVLYAKWNEKSCVTPGTLITLADGTQKAVEELTGDEMLLVWDMFNGTFSAAPILFIDSDPLNAYEVITLTFADGTEVEVIDEHGFWNVDLNEYVFLRADAAKYIGDKFNKQTVDANGNMTYTAVELVGVSISTEYTTAWSPVTYGHLCYYVNGMLSMPGATTGLINIFEVDPDTMKVDEEAYAEDIAEYGVYTYEEFTEEIAEVPELIFNAFGGPHLKVAFGKGILTEDMILDLISRYSEFFE